MPDYDVIVVGGGMVGVSIAFGLARQGQRTALFDEGDIAFRAARGNFGLVWVQGKGSQCPEYASWTRRSAELWKEFDQDIRAQSRIDTGYIATGGLHFCLNEQDFERRDQMLSRMVDDSHNQFQYQMLGRAALIDRVPLIGSKVLGASFCPQDGHVNPLGLLHALHLGFQAQGGVLRIEKVQNLSCSDSVFKVTSSSSVLTAHKVVLAAGLANKNLAPKLGLNIPVFPQRGQILVTEKIKPFLNYPTSLVRQTKEGGVLLGDSHEDVGFNDGTSIQVMHDIAHHARSMFPFLDRARVVRAWGALRIMSADGLPIYDQSEQYPGAFSASTHSGVTLAAAHSLDFSRFVVEGKLPSHLDKFSEKRFHVH
jgi:glycine/D-amino acid oxidase-like deaminating enzyme